MVAMQKKYLNLEHITDSALVLICSISIFGGLVYRIYALNNLGVIISLILAIIAFFIIQYFYLISNKYTRHQAPVKPEKARYKLINFILYILYFILLAACFFILLKHGTQNSIVSPWQVAPNYFFIFYFLTALSLIANTIFNKKFALPLIITFYFLSFSAALIVYRLGYGYDSFIHQATEKLIAQTGAVSPKPFYYLGQYGLIVILNKLASLPIIMLDKILLPLLAAVFLPIALWRALKNWLHADSLNSILILAALIIGFPFLIVTTPQNLAYVFLLLTILCGLSCKNYYDFSVIFLLAAAAAIIHPLAGIPALLFCAALAVFYSDSRRIKKYFYPLLFICSTVILPAIFYVINRSLPAAAAAQTAGASEPAGLAMPNGENFILNTAYLYGLNLKYIIAALALAGMLIAWRHRAECRILFIYSAMAGGLLASYLISVKLPFAFLINYEREDFPERILLAAALFLLPFILLALYFLFEKIAKKNIFIKSCWAAFLALTLTAALYNSYPRYDNYFNSRGYSVSAADIGAVNWINEDAKESDSSKGNRIPNSDFIVLANQQVAAAALSQFGFKKYYGPDQLFYYPIPTGSPLYGYYLDMVYKKPARETMYAAMDLAGVNLGYFVLNNYWFEFKKILDEAKLSADSWQPINGGQDYVFKYERK